MGFDHLGEFYEGLLSVTKVQQAGGRSHLDSLDDFAQVTQMTLHNNSLSQEFTDRDDQIQSLLGRKWTLCPIVIINCLGQKK